MDASAKSTPPVHAPPNHALRAPRASLSDATGSQNVVLLDTCTVSVGARLSGDARVALIADRQRGRVARAQLIDAGLGASAIDRRVRAGRLVREHPLVYLVPGTREAPLGVETGAVLAAGAGGALSHHSAATHLRLRPGLARPVHVTVPFARRGPALDGVVIHRSRILAAGDIVLHDGLPVTSAGRTLLDIAAKLPDGEVERLFDQALFLLKIVTLEAIVGLLARAGRHPGRARLTRVVRRYDPSRRTESKPQKALLVLIRLAGLPLPLTEFSLLGYRLDLYWPKLKLAAEVDTYGTHGSAGRFEADRRRDARLLAEAGVTVMRFTDVAIRGRPLETIAVLAAAIADRQRAVA